MNIDTFDIENSSTSKICHSLIYTVYLLMVPCAAVLSPRKIASHKNTTLALAVRKPNKIQFFASDMTSIIHFNVSHKLLYSSDADVVNYV